MSTKRKLGFALAVASVLALAGASPALAQEAEEGGAGDIIVTARRVEERLQDVPISITVFFGGLRRRKTWRW